MTISSANEKHIGDQEYQLLLRKYSNRILPKSHKISIFVRNIAQRIINANHLSGVWDVTIIDDPTPNAFVIPGGKIFVFTGILPLIADEDGMAAILGHEMVIRH
jgi:predicted Zn-dependent protease